MKQFGGIRTAGCIHCPLGAACLGGSSQHRWSCWFQRCCEFCFDSISFLFPNPASFFLFFPFFLSIFLHVSCDTQTGAYCKEPVTEPNRPRPSATNIAKLYVCIYFRIKPTKYSKCLIICNLFSYLKLVLFSIHIPVAYMPD